MALKEVKVPDIGDMADVEVIEVLVKPGDTVEVDQSLLTVESDKASMEIPSSHAGVVREIAVKLGDRVSEGTVVLTLDDGAAVDNDAPPTAPAGDGDRGPAMATATTAPQPEQPPAPTSNGVAPFLALPPWPQVDFARFGDIEYAELSRIRKASGAALHRNWVMIPHVTNHDNADVTGIEAFRAQTNSAQGSQAARLTMLAFLVKACVSALREFPHFNASLDGERLVLKKYFHIGVAVDTPRGLVVPVIRNADQKGLMEIAREAAELAARARAGTLVPGDMTGGTFSISSLGGIGGTYFTPIINAPEVAILGAGRAAIQPVWNGEGFAPRQILPLSLSWDHRVIDGAQAARFNAHLVRVLGDYRLLTL